jgi:hypothetical protein
MPRRTRALTRLAAPAALAALGGLWPACGPAPGEGEAGEGEGEQGEGEGEGEEGEGEGDVGEGEGEGEAGEGEGEGEAPPARASARLEGGVLHVDVDRAALVGDCAGAGCDDVDDDGLVDAWEDALLERLRPVLQLDEQESLVDDVDAVVGFLGRVAVVSTAPLDVRVFIMLGYSRDYGSCGVTAHEGDSERVAVRVEGVDDDTVRVVAAYTAAHEGEVTDAGRVFTGDALRDLSFIVDGDGQPRWLVFSSQDKHATYGTLELCEGASIVPCIEEDCGADDVDVAADFRVDAAIANAGEEFAARVDDLAVIGFPGERAFVDQPFCGGGARDGGCASAVREKLLVDPF